MRYYGGKLRLSPYIAQQIKYYRKPNQLYIEPFVGGFHIPPKVNEYPMLLSDANKPLMVMYKALKDGWIPPDNMTEDEYYNNKKTLTDNNPLKAFTLIGCSFGAKWNAGYARGEADGHAINFCLRAKNSLLKIFPILIKVNLLCIDYRELSPSNAIIYCDPPYENTEGYQNYYKSKFYTKEFWEVMRKWSKDNIVLISEYIAPDDFNCIWQFNHFLSVRSINGCEKRIEKLFIHRDHNNKKYIFPEINNIYNKETNQLSMDFNTL